ncbi:MAG: ChaN family lipoprotein [Phycisphaerae bacterium]|nr:ChaN family lipoprotein [Phycisphaerae bacterium]
MRVVLLVFIGWWSLFLAACATGTRSGAHAEATVAPRDVRVFAGSDGSSVPWAGVVDAARHAEVVIVGENHGHPLGLASAAALWDDLLASAPDAGLSLEFFERDQQAGVDDYRLGLTDEAAFTKATGRTPGSYPAGHKAMVESARAADRPVIAANAPRRYVRVARKDGFDALRRLTPEQRRFFRLPDVVPEGRYRDDFIKLMTEGPGHGDPDPEARQKQAEEMFRSQSVWDWTMAQSVVDALDAGAVPVLHVVGRFHSDFDGGLVQAVRLLRPGARVVTVSFVAEWSDALRDDDRERADFVVYAGPGPS